MEYAARVLNKRSLSARVRKKSIPDIAKVRDIFPHGTPEWEYLNQKKASALEAQDSSATERIIYFWEDSQDLSSIANGVTRMDRLPNWGYMVEKRSLLEFNKYQRHPIACAIVRYNDKYYCFEKENGALDFIKGHVKEEHINGLSLNKTVLNGLKAEMYEILGVEDNMVSDIRFCGIVKEHTGNSADHLHVVYEVTLTTDKIVHTKGGRWINTQEFLAACEAREIISL